MLRFVHVFNYCMLLALTLKFELICSNSAVSQQKKACKRESVQRAETGGGGGGGKPSLI